MDNAIVGMISSENEIVDFGENIVKTKCGVEKWL